ncbi:hypothetical protein SS50377_25624 [Spironucleus salmonicida]|uniref:Uncharacterized protein n=1 Tax=Spironucleus salmonicida TaxID=348837 RepID=V6LY31_9EUKA|nr:hypothetical protein SS50377_25624 [Spironucleus salmonicida]|eukprot:EST49475.1 Hypothetical protein SS50377_10224 [Spironucleus salmonicida]
MSKFLVGHASIDIKHQTMTTIKNSQLITTKLDDSVLIYAEQVISSNDQGNCILFIKSGGFARLYQAQLYEQHLTLQQFPTASGNSLPTFETCTIAQSGTLVGVLGKYKNQILLYIFDFNKCTAARIQSNNLNSQSKIFSANGRLMIFNDKTTLYVNIDNLSVDQLYNMSPIIPHGNYISIYHKKLPIFVSSDGIWSYDNGLFLKISPGILECDIIGNYFVNLTTSFIKEIPQLIVGLELEKQNYVQCKQLISFDD